MKILRVSLGNLASLAGEAVVDFEGEVLGDLPVFAITGRTGAGKSTLLDAICLGLYGKTPRYDAERSTAAAVGEVRGDDERNILRRGTGKGWAEVDFLGRDGHRYRARWEVRRAREKADAALQPAAKSLFLVKKKIVPTGEVTVIPPAPPAKKEKTAGGRGRRKKAVEVAELPDFFAGYSESPAPEAKDGTGAGTAPLVSEELELIASGKGATEEIEKRIGLSFNQFRHAVLLAQGEFKAFLEAKEDERGALLEAITGADIYSRLSREAYRRKAEADARLRELELALAGIQTLEEEDRAKIETELAAARERDRALARELEACRKGLEWFAEDDRRAAACENARRELEAVERALAERGEDFARLQAWEALEPIRADWARLKSLEADLAASEKRHAALDGERAQKQAELEKLTAAEAGARQALEAALQSLESARPELDAARRLDQACAQAKRLAGEAAEAVRTAEAQRRQAAEALEALGRETQEKRAALTRDGAWLAAREAVRLVLEDHEAVGRRLEELARQRRALAEKTGKLAKLRAAEAECAEALKPAQDEHAAARTRLEQYREALEAKREALRGLGPEALRERDRALQARLGVLESAARDLAELKRDEAAQAEIEQELEKTETARAAAAGRVAELERARQETETKARGLRESLERLGRALASDLAALRAELHAGEPCPLCGAAEHPWAERAALTALGEELGAMRAELKALEQNGERLAGDEKLARGEVAAAEGALGQLRRQRADGLKRIGQRRKSLEQTRQTLPGGAAALDELDGLLAASRGELAQVAGLLGEVRRLEQETEEFQKRGEQEAKAVEETGAALNELTERAHALGVRGEGLRGEIGASEEQLAGLAEELRQTLAGQPEWGAALGALPTHEDGGNLVTLREALRAEALEYRETRRRQQEAEAALQALAERRAAGEACARGLEDQLVQAQALLARRQAELEAAGRERAAVLGGRAADDAEAALNGALKQTRQAHELARQTLDAARQRLSELEGTLRSLAEHLAGIQTDLTAVRARVEMFAEKARFTAEQIGQTLELETAWLEETRQARERLTRQREHTLGQAEALRRQLEAHRAAPPPHAREHVEARRAALAQEQEKLKNELEGFLSRLAVDDQSRARLGEKRQELETAREGALVWQKLGEAIGSADGKKLRTYAQGLTLRALEAHANAHLRQLRPRYALRQNGQAPMDLVLVDRDMGGEVRTVRSLSGGESFLVSLALALGLSNMAARDLSIDSLFIDEGFGTLDGDTLQMALAVLQGLHAQGKQVGIISHVEGIAPSLGAEVSVEAVEPGRSRVRVRMAL